MLKTQILSIVIVTGFLAAVCSDKARFTGLQTNAAGIRPAGSMSLERAAHTATRLNDGKVLITGGMKVNGEFHDACEVFDPATGRFETLPRKLTKKRVSHTATRLKDGRVLIAGGWSNRTAPEVSTEIFDPKTGRFSPMAPMTFRRSDHTATLLDDGKVLFAGGHDGDKTHDSVDLFDPATGTFKVIGLLKTPRRIHTATMLSDGKILIAGGEVKDGEIVASAEIFDPSKARSEPLSAKLSFPRYKHDAVALKDGRVLIYGGSDARDLAGRLNTAEVFDPRKKSFERVGDLKNARYKVTGTAVVLGDGRVLIAGGAERAELFDPKSGQFSLVEGSYGHTYHFASATLLDDGRALIIGGYRFRSGQGPLATNSAWIFGNG